jgi:restriction endonuclease Mrr
MLCAFCKRAEAVVHLSQIRDAEVVKLDLCEPCATQSGVNAPRNVSVADLLLGTQEKPSAQRVTLQVTRHSLEVASAITQDLVEYFANHPREMKTMNRRLFEELIAELWVGFGYKVELTAQTRDGGKDIIAVRNDLFDEMVLIECKRPEPHTVLGVKPVRELLGVKVSEGATKAILATTAFFSNDARLLFENMRWELEGRDYDGLQDWIQKYLKLRGGGRW